MVAGALSSQSRRVVGRVVLSDFLLVLDVDGALVVVLGDVEEMVRVVVVVVAREVVSEVSTTLERKAGPLLIAIRERPPHSTEPSSSHSQKVSSLLTFSGSHNFRQSRARSGSCSPGNFTKTLLGHLELERPAAVLVEGGVVGGIRIS